MARSAGLRRHGNRLDALKLIGQAITDAKQGHSLHRLTHSLMYATDLADRLEYQIIPALRSGFIVLADRYIYTAIARGISAARTRIGFAIFTDSRSSPTWFSTCGSRYKDLVPRVLSAGKMNYWEAGMDMNYGDDLYDSFVAYQSELIEQFNAMADESSFVTIDARQEAQTIQRELRRAVGRYLSDNHELAGQDARPGRRRSFGGRNPTKNGGRFVNAPLVIQSM